MKLKKETNQSIKNLKKEYPCLKDSLSDKDFTRKIFSLDKNDEAFSLKVLDLIWDMIQKKDGDETKEEWLESLCYKLINNIFPDKNHKQKRIDEEEEMYLSLLLLLINATDNSNGFNPCLDILRFDRRCIEKSRVYKEFNAYEEVIKRTHIIELLRIARCVQPFDLASHIIGVHNVAVSVGMEARRCGFNVDLPMLSSASLCHDIGKFGCRGEDAKRVPFIHYYYTWQWFNSYNLENIGYISANHSTWDLEFENLPIESLLLIYADFRVRGTKDENGKEIIKIYTLDEAYSMIFSKLCNMTEEKIKRYKNVYLKLRDFEILLKDNGVDTQAIFDERLWKKSQELDFSDDEKSLLKTEERRDNALLLNEETLRRLRSRTLKGSIKLMEMVSTEATFSHLLETARSEKNLHRIRTYLILFEEYNTYLSKKNKKKLLKLLYELLSHSDGDVRRFAGEIMGKVLANSGPTYRKEAPLSEHENIATPTMMALLDESAKLWEYYIDKCLHPDLKKSRRHIFRISNSLKVVCKSLFNSCREDEARNFIKPLLCVFYDTENNDPFVLVDVFSNIPTKYIPKEEYDNILSMLETMLDSQKVRLRLLVLNCLYRLLEIDEIKDKIIKMTNKVSVPDDENRLAILYLKNVILGKEMDALSDADVSYLFLSNLKTAVHWTVKLTQISLILEEAKRHDHMTFHSAMHFSNLLCVSEHLPVREFAGEHLVRIVPYLSIDQINEISVDLVREIETGEEQIVRFIPPYLAKLCVSLPDKELKERIERLEMLVHKGSPRSACVALETIGEITGLLYKKDKSLANYLLGIIMVGICHYNETISQKAFRVLCITILGNEDISLENRGEILSSIAKKLSNVLPENNLSRLTFFNNCAMLNHLYRLIVRHEVNVGNIKFEKEKPVAFFPGTFDPFSLGHKEIVKELRKREYEVYLAIDEFSWSKRTLPKLYRRRIASMSVADSFDTYIFPDNIPINIANKNDLAKLKELFPNRDVYLVEGSDVVLNASAYKTRDKGSARYFKHILFYRGNKAEINKKVDEYLDGEYSLFALPKEYEQVSSTRIREYVDRQLDISNLVDPVVESYIYEKGFYIRCPESKTMISTHKLSFRTSDLSEDNNIEFLNGLCETGKNGLVTMLNEKNVGMLGFAVGETMSLSELYKDIKDITTLDELRNNVSGRILFIKDIVSTKGNLTFIRAISLLNELLARSLEKEHTYALCKCENNNTLLRKVLLQLGFIKTNSNSCFYFVDMRRPIMILQDMKLYLKMPYQDNKNVNAVIEKSREKLRQAFNKMYPGKLLLCFNSEILNQSLMERIEKLNGVFENPSVKQGKSMCVPYGKILLDSVVPKTVTKALHVEKVFSEDVKSFKILEYPGYSSLKNQVRTLKSFNRPLILVDDLLHNSNRIKMLDKVFKEENIKPEKIVVAVMSGSGQDLLREKNREVECEYFIPNLHYWVKESLLYPFIGGDSLGVKPLKMRMLPSINLLLPFYYPNYFKDGTVETIQNLSMTALKNTYNILETVEKEHQNLFDSALTIRNIGEILNNPRIPITNKELEYDYSLSPTVYVKEFMMQLDRIRNNSI